MSATEKALFVPGQRSLVTLMAGRGRYLTFIGCKMSGYCIPLVLGSQERQRSDLKHEQNIYWLGRSTLDTTALFQDGVAGKSHSLFSRTRDRFERKWNRRATDRNTARESLANRP